MTAAATGLYCLKSLFALYRFSPEGLPLPLDNYGPAVDRPLDFTRAISPLRARRFLLIRRG